MGWLSSAISVAGGLLGATQARNSAQAQYNAQLGLMNAQYEHNKTMYQNRHQWEVEDLRKAGLNPILSANSGAVPAGVAGGSVSMSDAGAEVSKGISSSQEVRLRSRELDIAEKNADTNYVNALSQKLTAEAAWRNSGTQERVGYSAIQLNQKESEYKDTMIAFEKKQMELNERMTNQNVKESEQRIANSILEVAGKLELMRAQGYAAVTQADAAQAMAATAEKNGVSLRDLQSADMQKVQKELEAVGVDIDLKRLNNPRAFGDASDWWSIIGQRIKQISPLF